MACALLDKLPAELRKQIYEYLLDFDNVPLRHATQLQPFVNKIAYGERKLPFKFLDLRVKDPTSGGTACDLPFFDKGLIDTGILSENRLIYTEAIKTFYDLNVFSVDIGLFKLRSLRPRDVSFSDLSLAKSLVVTFKRSYEQNDDMSRGYNTIDCCRFFESVRALFPKLEALLIKTDGTSRPSTSLFDISQDLETIDEVTTVKFDGVGSIIAEYNAERLVLNPGHFTIRVQYKALVEACNFFDNPTKKGSPSGSAALSHSVANAWNLGCNVNDETSPYHYAAKERFEVEKAAFFEVMNCNCRYFWRQRMGKDYKFEFYTNLVYPYEPYSAF